MGVYYILELNCIKIYKRKYAKLMKKIHKSIQNENIIPAVPKR